MQRDRAIPLRRPAAWLVLLLPLAGCAHRRIAVIDAPPAPPVRVAAAALPGAAPSINAGLSSAATLWHLRAALNVAALACRGDGEAVTAARYNALLARQRTALAAAQVTLAAEYRAGGGRWQDRYDGAMTRLYNHFSAAPVRARFCAAAIAVLAEAQGLAPAALPDFAATRLPLLDAAVAGGWTPDPPRPPLATVVAPPPVAPARRPRLVLDLSTLPPD